MGVIYQLAKDLRDTAEMGGLTEAGLNNWRLLSIAAAEMLVKFQNEEDGTARRNNLFMQKFDPATGKRLKANKR